MSTLSHDRQRARTKPRRRAHNPLAAPLLLFTAAAIAAAGYIALVLWPQWPDAPIAGDAPLPVVVAGVVFNIEPAAIRATVQRHPGTHDRIDLDYVWPSLEPPGTPTRPTLVAPDAKDRLFVTIASGAATLPIADRVRDIYPRYLAAEQSSAPRVLLFAISATTLPTKARTWFSKATRPSIFSHAARATASPIRASACSSGASATPTSLSASRATGFPIGARSRAASTSCWRACIRAPDGGRHPARSTSRIGSSKMYDLRPRSCSRKRTPRNSSPI